MKRNGIAVIAVLMLAALTLTKDASAQVTLPAPHQPAGRLQNSIVDGSNVGPTYHFRGVATDDGQIDFGNDGSGQSTIPLSSYGDDVTFTMSTPSSVPSPPTANPATYVASNSLTARWGTVSGATGYRLDVSPSSSFGTYVAGYQNLNVGNVTNRNVIGLNASTTYYYRVRAYNGMGTSGNSNTVVATTLSTTGPPIVTTNLATNVGSFSAMLNGTVDPHGLTTTVYFQYGTTTNYGSRTASQTKTGNTYQNVSANIPGLAASTTYHFRIVAMNNGGTRYGVDRIFTTLSATGPPVAITDPATYIASLSARLNGSVYPHGLATTVHLEYGTTTSYGHATANQSKTGNTYQTVVASIGGLAASTTYHFRIVAMNSGGTRYGVDRTFSTLSATGPPVAITNPATNVAISSAGLNGTVNPHGLPTTVRFQYGTTASYGHTTTNQSMTGNAYQNMAANISGLAARTIYHFRTVAMNSGGTRNGADRTFTTLGSPTPTATATATPTVAALSPTPEASPTATSTATPTVAPPTPTATATPTATPTCIPAYTPGPWAQAAPVTVDHYGGFIDGVFFFCDCAYEGGGYSFSASDNINQFGRFDLVANTWTALASVPDLNNAMSSAVYAPNVNKLFVFGGERVSTATVVNITRIYDIGTNTWSVGAPMPGTRAFMGSGYYNGKIYLVGGYSTANLDPSFGQVWEYDPLNNTWNTSRASMPITLGGPGCGIINGHIYIAGGRNIGNTNLNTLYDYDIAANTWTQRANLFTGVNVPGSAVIGGELWVFGGGSPFLGLGVAFQSNRKEVVAPDATNILQIYDPASNTWTSGPNLTQQRSFPAGTHVGETALAVGGYTGSTTTTSVEINVAIGFCPTPTPTPTASL